MGDRCDDIVDMRTICEVHREIYTLVTLNKGTREEILSLVEEAYSMAKRMNAKLRQYNRNYDDNWYESQRKSAKELRKELQRLCS